MQQDRNQASKPKSPAVSYMASALRVGQNRPLYFKAYLAPQATASLRLLWRTCPHSKLQHTTLSKPKHYRSNTQGTQHREADVSSRGLTPQHTHRNHNPFM